MASSEGVVGYNFLSRKSAKTFGVLMEHAFSHILKKSKGVMLIQMVSYLVIASYIGIGNAGVGRDATRAMTNIGCVFCIILFIVLIASMPTILAHPRDMTAFMRKHHRSKRAPLAFYFARVLMDLPFHLLFSSAYALVVYRLTSQPMSSIHLFPFLSICVLTSFVSYSLGMMISVELSGHANGVHGVVSMATIVPLVLLTGFVLDFKLIASILNWLTWIGYVRYAFEGALIAIYGFERERLECWNDYCHFQNPLMVLSEFSIETDDFYTDISALVFCFITFQALAILLILWRSR